MTTFKVGDLVRIKDCGCGQPQEWVGKIMPIHEVQPTGNVGIKEPDSNSVWTFVTKRLERVESVSAQEPRLNTYKFRFTIPDGTPGYVYVNVYNNVTVVTIIVNPAIRYSLKNKPRQFFGGIAFCHPKDKFDITIGIKEACKHALESSWVFDDDKNYKRAIYSSIRRAMRGDRK